VVNDAIASLLSKQTTLEASIATMKAAQTNADTKADTFFADTTVADSIAAGFVEMTAQFTAQDTKLNRILNQQQQALAQLAAAEARQNRQLALAQAALEQQKKLAAAVENQFAQVAAALNASSISAAQAAELQNSIKLSGYKASKRKILSTIPCQATYTNYPFSLENHVSEFIPNSARTRILGTNNRVLLGALMYITRTDLAPCSGAETRFPQLGGQCPIGVSTASYGVDPVFKQGTSLYDAELDVLEFMLKFYNCSKIEGTVTYDADPQSQNAFPKCKELFKDTGVPYGFHQRDLPSDSGGFPVFYDINLDEDNAERWVNYMEEGLLLDPLVTETVDVTVVVYNAELQFFAVLKVFFRISAGRID